METPPRRPRSPPRGRCLLGGQLDIPIASPISITRGMPRPAVSSDEDSYAQAYNTPLNLRRPRPLEFEEDSPEEAEEQESRRDPAPNQSALILSGVRRSMRIMQLQKSSNVEEKPPGSGKDELGGQGRMDACLQHSCERKPSSNRPVLPRRKAAQASGQKRRAKQKARTAAASSKRRKPA